MDLFSLFLLTNENNEIKSPTKIYDFTVRLRVSVTCTFTIKHGTHVPVVTCSHLYDAYRL